MKPDRIGSRIATLLDGLGQSAAWLAQQTGLERSTITRVIRHERQPTLQTLALIAPALGLTVEDLVATTNAVSCLNEKVDQAGYERMARRVQELEAQFKGLTARVRNAEASERAERDRRRRAEAALEAARSVIEEGLQSARQLGSA